MTPCHSRFPVETSSKNMLLPLQMETVMLDWGSWQLGVKYMRWCLLWGLRGSAVKSPDRKLLKPFGTPQVLAKTSDITVRRRSRRFGTGILRTHKTHPDLFLRAVCETVKLLTVTSSTLLSRISSGANWDILFRNSFTTGYKTADHFPILFPGSTVCQVSIIPTGLAGVKVLTHFFGTFEYVVILLFRLPFSVVTAPVEALTVIKQSTAAG